MADGFLSSETGPRNRYFNAMSVAYGSQIKALTEPLPTPKRADP